MRIFIFLCFFFSFMAHAQSQDSLQLAVLSGTALKGFHGELQRFERNDQEQPWRKVGVPMEAVVGKKGFSAHKREGDLKTPLGLFELGPVFGYEKNSASKMPYLVLQEDTLCIDDPHSAYYQAIINATTIKHPDWHSAEQMRKIDLYRQGVVFHNKSQQGSCLFIHRFRSMQKGTAGCVGMSERDLESLLAWLDASKKPQLLIKAN